MTSSSQLIDSVADTTAHRDRDDLDGSIARLLLQFLDADYVAVHRLHDDGGAVRVARRVALNRAHPDQEERASQDDLAQLPTLHEVPAWSECVRRRELTRYTDASGLARSVFPIDGEHGVIGLLEVSTREALRGRDTDMVSGILRIMRNHIALLDYGERDTLTGLFNRKILEATFEKLRARLGRADATGNDPRSDAARAATVEQPSWLGVADIDHFKAINDTYGHLFGDEVLLLVAQLMKKSFRGGDLLFRFGGEEFVIVLERTSAIGASIAFERLRTEIEAFKFPQVGRVTLSLGYTRIDPRDASATCVERADAALYYAKNHGRNDVRNYETLVASGALQPKAPPGEDIELF